MAIYPGCEPVYEYAEQFKLQALTAGASLLWPGENCWTPELLVQLRQLFGGEAPAEGSFLQRWHQQIATAPIEVHKLAAELTAIYLLFPSGSQPSKLADLQQVLSWRLGESQPHLQALMAPFAHPIGNPGPPYIAKRQRQIEFLIEFAKQALEQHIDPSDRAAYQSIADDLVREIPYSKAARHVLLHLLFPAYYERIASSAQKNKILTAYPQFVEPNQDRDAALLSIRAHLAAQLGREDLDFYDPDLQQVWNPTLNDNPNNEEEEEEQDEITAASKVWIEKTIVNGRPDRENGEYAMGKALWSPQKDKGGADIYRFMREVQEGDLVLHLVDNEAIAGISEAANGHEEFNGVAGTSWGEGPSYLVKLKNFRKLDPPLSRDVFFSSPFKEQLQALAIAGESQLFFTKEPSLRQGAYLTPAPPSLVAILNAAYQKQFGKLLLEGLGRAPQSPVPQVTLEELAAVTNLQVSELDEIKSLLKEKKQLILEGPPGSGKTFVAEKFARYITGNPLSGTHDEKFVLVQFHQSYSYEDFVEGIRPKTTSENRVIYEVVEGAFKELCNIARRSTQPHVILIDEINRGNLSRIFGELLLLLEYRKSCNVKLPYSRLEFTIPDNLYVIGTMNTTDRSLAQIDYALRRRFYFYRLLPTKSGTAPVLESWLKNQTGFDPGIQVEVLKLFVALNAKLTQSLGEHFQIGHSYFMTPEVATPEGRKKIWNHAVLPLIEEYFFNRRDGSFLKEYSLDSLCKLSSAAASGD